MSIKDLRHLKQITSGRFGKIFEDTKNEEILYKIGAPEDREILRNQFFLLKSLDSPNFAKVYEWIENKEFCGYSIERIIWPQINIWGKDITREGGKKYEMVKSVLLNILDAIQYMHKKGVIHGDLKPSHIFVSKDGEIKIIDPGYDPDILTPAYAAPEALLGEVTESSDIYSIGIIFYEILTGKVAYPGSIQEIIEKKFNEELPPLPSIDKFIPPVLDDLLFRMISPKAEMRYRNIDEIWMDIRLKKGIKVRPSFIPVFVDREEELNFFERVLSEEEPRIMFIIGKKGIGKTSLLHQMKIRSLQNGISVRMLGARDFSDWNVKSTDKNVILIDEPENIERIIQILRDKKDIIPFSNILIVITSYNPPNLGEDFPLEKRAFELKPLKRDDIVEISTLNFPNLKNRGRLIEFISERSEGNPLLIYILFHSLCKNGLIERIGNEYEFKVNEAKLTEAEVPGILKLKADELSREEKKLAKHLSIFGIPVDIGFIESVGLSRPYLVLMQLVSRGILTKKGGKVFFNNEWMREYFFKLLKRDEKKNIHRLIASSKVIRDPEILYRSQEILGMTGEAVRSLWRAARERIKAGDYKAGLKFLKKSVKLKNDRLLDIIVARLYDLTGDFGNAASMYHSLQKGFPDKPFFLFKEGMNLRRIGENKRAESIFKGLLKRKIFPFRQRVIYEYGRLLLAEKQGDKAEKLIESIKGKYTIPGIPYLKALIYYEKKAFEDAITVCKDALKKNYSDMYKKAFLNLIGISFQGLEKYEESIDYFKMCIELDRKINDRLNEAVHRSNIGFSLLRLDRYSDAVTEIEDAIEVFRRLRNFELEKYALANLAIIFLRLGNWDELKKRIWDFEKYYNKVDILLRESLFYAHLYQGNFEEAKKLLNGLKKDRELFLIAQGHLHFQRGDYKGSGEFFLESLKILSDQRDRREISSKLAESLFYQGNIEEAREIITPFVDDIPSISSPFEKASLLSTYGLLSGVRYLKEARLMFSDMGLPFYVAETDMKAGILYYSKKNYRDAVQYLREAEGIFRNLGARALLSRVREILSVCAEKLAGRGGYAGVTTELERLISIIDAEQRLDKILSLLIEFLGAERGAIISTVGREPEIVSSTGIDKLTMEDARRISRTITGRASKGEILISDDAEKDERFRDAKSISRNRIKSILCVPIISEENIYGVLYLDSTIKKGVFMPEDRDFLQSIGRIIGILISKGNLMDRLKNENVRMKDFFGPGRSFNGIIGVSPVMKGIFEMIKQIAPMDANVLITGETGTGKGLTAEVIHKLSKRRDGKFVTVECSSIPRELLESELFGHRQGSFTGAVRDKEGMCEVAHKGTLFLDEIGELPMDIQSKLLHLTDTGEIRRIGETEWRKVDLRIIAATNKDLELAIAMKEFRSDLFYRLNHFHIHLPPLRERTEDIPLIAEQRLEILNSRSEKSIEGISNAAMNAMVNYPWPGNVRELINTIEVVFYQKKGGMIGIGDLPEKIKTTYMAESKEIRYVRDKLRRDTILNELDLTGWNIKRTAERLNVSRRHLYRIMERLGIKRKNRGKKP